MRHEDTELGSFPTTEDMLDRTDIKKEDAVNHPSHYQGKNGIEVQQVLESFVDEAGFLGFCKCNVLKYVLRAEKKNGLEDYRKAQWYLERMISVLEKK